jgi:hypothetical protein
MDNETGIFMYAWAAGTEVCGTDVVRWRDPFASQRDSTHWSFASSLSQLGPLPDGLYYLSVRAYNNVQRGGPLVTTVCNTVPLVIDTTKPVLVNFTTDYDDNSSALIARYLFV